MTSRDTAKGLSINNQERLRQLDKDHFLHPQTSLRQHQEQGPRFIFTEGKGIYLTDVCGNSYLDGLASLWNVNVGHGRKELAETAKKQMERLAYSSAFANFSHDAVIQLSAKLASLTPGDINVFFYTSGGSESNDTAIKLVRHYWKLKGQPEKKTIIALEKGYHGVTIGASSATGIVQFQAFSPAPAPGFVHAVPHKLNCEQGDRTDPHFKRSIRGLIEELGAENIAAVLIEPVQGAGGVNIPPDGYLATVRRLCDEFNVLLIADEVICGFGRTGRMFGVDHWQVVPDVMTMAKGITSGYMPLGAVGISTRLRDELSDLTDQVLFHGFTYSAHPTACAVALKNLDIIEKEGLVEHAAQMERVLLQCLKQVEETCHIAVKARAKGLLGAIELQQDPATNQEFAPELKVASRVAEECFKRQLIVRPIVYGGRNIIAMSPPLVITPAEIEKMTDILAAAIKTVEKEL